MPSKLTRRQKTNLRYLYDRVFPHLQSMPTVDDCLDDDSAFLDLENWTNKDNANNKKISNKYNCGKSGCVAGWYVMMSDEKHRFDQAEDKPHFTMSKLGEHFGISTFEADLLFEGKGEGSERLNHGQDACLDTQEIITERMAFLETLMTNYGLRLVP